MPGAQLITDQLLNADLATTLAPAYASKSSASLPSFSFSASSSSSSASASSAFTSFSHLDSTSTPRPPRSFGQCQQQQRYQDFIPSISRSSENFSASASAPSSFIHVKKLAPLTDENDTLKNALDELTYTQGYKNLKKTARDSAGSIVRVFSRS